MPTPDAMTPRAISDPPGGVLPWLVVALELLTFAIVLVLVAVQRHSAPAAFAEGQQALDARFGLALTLTLVTSGALAAQGVHAFRLGRLASTRKWFFAAALLGIGFLIAKLMDFSAHAAAGHRLGASDFWDAYVLATGFHALHMLIGIALLLFVVVRLGGQRFEDEETAIAGAALFWHLCDAVWFFLFPLFFARA